MKDVNSLLDEDKHAPALQAHCFIFTYVYYYIGLWKETPPRGAVSFGDVLLTGATGYLGIHILNELLANYHGKILCPVRAKGNDEALSRIKTLYFYYFGRTEASASLSKYNKTTTRKPYLIAR